MNPELSQAYYFGRAAYGTRQRCPYATAEMAAEWKRGRDDARRVARKDTRPEWRRWKKKSRGSY